MWQSVLLVLAAFMEVKNGLGSKRMGIFEDEENINLDHDMVFSPDIMARYRTLNNTDHIRRKRQHPSSRNVIIELAIFTDNDFHKFVRGRFSQEPEDKKQNIISNIIFAVINSVELYLNHESLGQKLSINIVQIFTPEDDMETFPEIRRYLDYFCKYQSEKRLASSMNWDHALLLTGQDLYSYPSMDKGSSGMAFLSGMCSKTASCTLAEARSLGSTALIIAHELGHNLGLEHDGSGRNAACDGENFIMGPRLSPGVTAWSQCSRLQMSQFLASYGDCLYNSPQGRAQEWDHEDGRLPGERFDGDSQCHLMYGTEWRLYPSGIVNGEQINICRAIWCRRGNSLRSPNAAALQGTSCGLGKQCDTGKCIKRINNKPHPSTPRLREDSTTKKPAEVVRPIYTNQMSVCDFFAIFGIRYPNCRS